MPIFTYRIGHMPNICTDINALPLPQQKAIALRFAGHTYEQIAKALGKANVTISSWFKPNGQIADVYSQYCHDKMNPSAPMTHAQAQSVADTIKSLAPMAIDTVADLARNAKREQVRLGAAADILDRAGYAPVQKMINVHAIDEMNVGELDILIGGILTNNIHAPIYKEASIPTSIDIPDLSTVTDETPTPPACPDIISLDPPA